ncbi:hypothetical protein FOL47_011362 [Perkinsus chesapeaki]|uniref:Tyr recombinase domain-containing protein n=1 Tax=Perkinsus chesapeaki TaxID=330153 RepID=A0A7J6MMP3_PERCH|nr:hypothetical protein FOL47_011362 [Perkinsus chesapeaki]
MVPAFTPLKACQRELSNRKSFGRPSLTRADRPPIVRGTISPKRRGSAKKASYVSKRLSREDVNAFVTEARAPSTRRSYEAIRKAYVRVMESAQIVPYPLVPAKAIHFIVSLVKGDYTYESGEERFKLALRAASKLCRQASSIEQKRAGTFTADEVIAIAHIQDPLHEGTVCAILCGVSCLLRVNELLALSKGDIHFSSDGLSAQIIVRRSKTDPSGRGCQLTVGCLCGQGPARDECAVHRLRWWVCVTCEAEDSLLFPYTRDRFIKDMSDLASRAIGFRGCVGRSFKGHSLRRSAAQILFHHGVNIEHIVEAGRWASSRSLSMAYLREGAYKPIRQAELTRIMLDTSRFQAVRT